MHKNNPSEIHETINDQAFIELVKECIGSENVLPVLTLLAGGKNTFESIRTALPQVADNILQNTIDKMIRFALVQPLVKTTDNAKITAWFLTPVGQEFLLILQDIERLKHKYSN